MPLKSIKSISKRIFSGGTPSTDVDKFWGGDNPWLSSGETSNRFIKSTLKTITNEGVEGSSTKLARKESIVIASAGQGLTRGQTSMLLIDTFINQSIIAIEINPNYANPYYVFYNLSGRYEELRSISDDTSSRGSLTTKLIGELEIDLPDMDTQNAIVELVKPLDDRIELLQSINDNLEEIANQLYDHCFPYSTSDALPDGWLLGKLGDIIVVHDSKRKPLSAKERSDRAKIYLYYGAASVTDHVDDYLFDGVYLLLGEDGTVVNDDGSPVLQYVSGKFWVNNHAHILTGRRGYSVESLYLLCQRLNIDAIITGAVQPKISQANLRDIDIVLPPESIASDFSLSISALFELHRQNTIVINRLTELKDYLLPKLMSGEIDVSTLKLSTKYSFSWQSGYVFLVCILYILLVYHCIMKRRIYPNMSEESLNLFDRHTLVNGPSGHGTPEFMRVDVLYFR